MPLKRKFSVELQRTISSAKAFKCIPCYEKFESIAATNFNNSFNLSNKNGQNSNQYHIYFLMDPRITCNLSNEAKQKNFKEIVIWKQFLNSIFYVGKAKSNRTYSHLYDAMNEYRKDIFNPKRSREKCLTLNKLRRIVDIWGNGLGVVSLQVFQNFKSSEAYTREAAIIDALNLRNLTNKKRGVYYGPSSNWTAKGKKLLGISLLYNAMQIFLSENETQLFPRDLIK